MELSVKFSRISTVYSNIGVVKGFSTLTQDESKRTLSKQKDQLILEVKKETVVQMKGHAS
jgi:hypothetical protein